MSKQISYSEFNVILEKLKEDYIVFAPVKLKEIGTHSTKDIIRYKEIDDVSSIIFIEKSDFSPKEIYFPITQTLFYFFNNNQDVPIIDDKKYIIIMRPCDINSLSVFESIFIKNGGNLDDYYYKRLREKVKIFMLECKTSFESCFCVSMDMNKTSNYDAALRFNKDNIICQLKSEEFAQYFDNIGASVDFEPEFVESNKKIVEVPQLDKITMNMFDDSNWTEYTSRCIACGRCNFVCPTCTCWSMQDVKYDENQ